MTDAAPDYHIPVLLQTTVDGLNVRPDGCYVDCTFGGGGHSREILRRLGPNGRLLAFDQDADAQRNIPAGEDRLTFVQSNFATCLIGCTIMVMSRSMAFWPT